MPQFLMIWWDIVSFHRGKNKEEIYVCFMSVEMRLIKSIIHYKIHVFNVKWKELETKCWETTLKWLGGFFLKYFMILENFKYCSSRHSQDILARIYLQCNRKRNMIFGDTLFPALFLHLIQCLAWWSIIFTKGNNE